ncbi:MAG TPA: hypothetical protein EYO21_09075 [Candidatus Marinimicrobia bacterium]|nr:hypothetical protein [Candidatus Neomarinimicrobiota bacterium]
MRNILLSILVFLSTTLVSQDMMDRKISVFSGGTSGLVDIEESAISSLVEEELVATGEFRVIEQSTTVLPLSFRKRELSGISKFASNLWRSQADTLDPSVAVLLDNTEIVIWRLKRDGRTYSYDFRRYSVETDSKNLYTYRDRKIGKRYLKGKARTTVTFAGDPENAAEAARVLAWYVVGLKPPPDRFDRGLVAGLSNNLKNIYSNLWFVMDSGFESLLIIVALIVMGGGLYAVASPKGDDLGYPPDYPGVP